ncbi:MAG: 30S ribosomal protein S20 [Fimbriimonadales bacterium]
MANLSSSKKDVRRSEKRRQVNQGVKSALKTYVKKVRTSAAASDATATTANLNQAMKALDKAVQRGVIHKNQAARRKSRIAKLANSASK